MTKRMALDVDQMNPFARMVYDYLLSCRPNKLVAELSEETGISNQTIWDWLRKGTLPRRATIVQLAERVPDLPLDDLLNAAGLPSTAEVKRQRSERLDMMHASVDEMKALLAQDGAYSPEEREMIGRFLSTLPEQFIRDTDTHREFHHESPTAFDAQRAIMDATITPPDEQDATPRAGHPPHRRRRPSGGAGGEQSRQTHP